MNKCTDGQCSIKTLPQSVNLIQQLTDKNQFHVWVPRVTVGGGAEHCKKLREKFITAKKKKQSANG